MAKLQIALLALVDRSGAVLLRRRDERSVTESSRWSLPGGSVNPKETPRAAATRHLTEQTGVKPSGPLQLVWRGFLPSMPVEVHFFAAATTARQSEVRQQSEVFTGFIDGEDVLSGRSFTQATGFVLGRFFDSLEYDSLAAQLDPNELA